MMVAMGDRNTATGRKLVFLKRTPYSYREASVAAMNLPTTLLALLLFASLTYAWDCPTHQYICQLENVTGDCCLADSNHTPGATKHHCTNNSSSCAARLAAQEYPARPEIAAHLLADAQAPPHWYSFTEEDHSRCHASFETAVGKKVGKPPVPPWLGWSVNVTGCHTKDGRVVDLYADEATFSNASSLVVLSSPLPRVNQDLPLAVTGTFIVILVVVILLALKR